MTSTYFNSPTPPEEIRSLPSGRYQSSYLQNLLSKTNPISTSYSFTGNTIDSPRNSRPISASYSFNGNNAIESPRNSPGRHRIDHSVSLDRPTTALQNLSPKRKASQSGIPLAPHFSSQNEIPRHTSSSKRNTIDISGTDYSRQVSGISLIPQLHSPIASPERHASPIVPRTPTPEKENSLSKIPKQKTKSTSHKDSQPASPSKEKSPRKNSKSSSQTKNSGIYISQYWTLVSTHVSNGVLKAGGSEKEAALAQFEVLNASSTTKDTSVETMNLVASKTSMAMIASGASHNIAAAASVSCLRGGEMVSVTYKYRNYDNKFFFKFWAQVCIIVSKGVLKAGGSEKEAGIAQYEVLKASSSTKDTSIESMNLVASKTSMTLLASGASHAVAAAASVSCLRGGEIVKGNLVEKTYYETGMDYMNGKVNEAKELVVKGYEEELPKLMTVMSDLAAKGVQNLADFGRKIEKLERKALRTEREESRRSRLSNYPSTSSSSSFEYKSSMKKSSRGRSSSRGHLSRRDSSRHRSFSYDNDTMHTETTSSEETPIQRYRNSSRARDTLNNTRPSSRQRQYTR